MSRRERTEDPETAERSGVLPVSADFLLLLYTEDRSLREALAVLTKERGWTLCAPDERCSREPSCILTDLDGKTGGLSENDFGDLPKYTVSFFEEKHPTLLRPFSEERFAALLASVGTAGTETETGEEEAGYPASGILPRISDTLFFDGTSLFLAGTRISLSKKERQIFALLYEADGQPLRVEEIADAVWGRPDAVNNVRVYIRYLRRKIAAVSDRNYIKTVREGGFYLRRDRDE